MAPYMKKSIVILACGITLLGYSACQKQSTIKPAPTKITDTTSKTDTTHQIKSISYPYTDTFSGLMTCKLAIINYLAKDTFFKFYVTHFTADSFVISNPKAIHLDTYVYDDLYLNVGRKATGSCIYNYVVSSRSYQFSLTNDSLHMNWDYFPDCYDDEYIGSYLGKKVI